MIKQEPAFKDFMGNRFVPAILLSGLFLQLGIWVRNFSVFLFVMEQTNEDPFAVSMISVVSLPRFLFFQSLEELLQTGGSRRERWFGVIFSAVFMVIGVILVLPLVLNRPMKKRVKVNI